MSDEEPTEGRRIGVHPLIVVFGVIFGLWLFVTLIIPKSKNIPTHGPGASPNSEAPLPGIMSSDLVPSFTVTGNVVGMNAITVLVHPATTDSQVIALLQSSKQHDEINRWKGFCPPPHQKINWGPWPLPTFIFFRKNSMQVRNRQKP